LLLIMPEIKISGQLELLSKAFYAPAVSGYPTA
jgi:hypothetical protein